MPMTGEEKGAFSDEAYKALDHPLVQDVMEELCFNLRIEYEGLPRYGLRKVALYVAIVARAQALGIDPDDLRSTPDEATEDMMRLAQAAHDAGKPVIVVTA